MGEIILLILITDVVGIQVVDPNTVIGPQPDLGRQTLLVAGANDRQLQQVYSVQPVISLPQEDVCPARIGEEVRTALPPHTNANEPTLMTITAMPLSCSVTNNNVEQPKKSQVVHVLVPAADSSGMPGTTQTMPDPTGDNSQQSVTVQHYLITKVIANTPEGPRVQSESALQLVAPSVANLGQSSVPSIRVITSKGDKSEQHATVMMPQCGEGIAVPPTLPPITIVCDCKKERLSSGEEDDNRTAFTPSIDPQAGLLSYTAVPITMTPNNPLTVALSPGSKNRPGSQSRRKEPTSATLATDLIDSSNQLTVTMPVAVPTSS